LCADPQGRRQRHDREVGLGKVDIEIGVVLLRPCGGRRRRREHDQENTRTS
jgi:hypothetical protein